MNLCTAAIVGALYVVLTLLSAAVGLSSGAIQVRISEALCVLPVFLPWSAVGLWIGCIIANLITSAAVWDIVFGSLATLIGALGALLLGVAARKLNKSGRTKLALFVKILVPLPTVLANAVIVPFVLIYAYGIMDMGYWLLVLTVGVGEIISAWILGVFVLTLLEKNSKIFKITARDKARRE
jgi:uncharacterized membrane protein